MSYRIPEANTKEMDEGDLAWAVIEPLWAAVDFSKGGGFVTETLSGATEGQRLLFAVDWCQKEVRNGGFEQFFINSAGMLWKDALAGFLAIGAKDYAVLLEKALSIFPNGEAHVSKTERSKVLRSVPKQKRTALFEPLEADFYQLLDSPDTDLERYRGTYVLEHPGEFFDG